MWLSAGYISSVARRSLTNSMRLINRIRARWFSFSGYYSSPHVSKTAYLKQLIRKRHRPLLSLSDPPSPSSPSGSPVANPSLPLSLLFSIAPACQSTLSPPNRALRFVPSFLAPLSAFFPLHPLTGVAYASTPLGLSAVNHLSVLIQCNLIIKCKLTYIYTNIDCSFSTCPHSLS